MAETKGKKNYAVMAGISLLLTCGMLLTGCGGKASDTGSQPAQTEAPLQENNTQESNAPESNAQGSNMPEGNAQKSNTAESNTPEGNTQAGDTTESDEQEGATPESGLQESSAQESIEVPESLSASQLSVRGGTLEAGMGQYFRQWLEDEGLFPENYMPEGNDVRMSGSMQTPSSGQSPPRGFSPQASFLQPIRRWNTTRNLTKWTRSSILF